MGLVKLLLNVCRSSLDLLCNELGQWSFVFHLLLCFHSVTDGPAAYLFSVGKTYYGLGLLALIIPQIILQVSYVWFVCILYVLLYGLFLADISFTWIKLLQVSGSNYITLGLKHKESVNSIRLNTFIWLQFQDFLKDPSILLHWIHVHMTAVSILSEGSS